jgi:hypothetical protein
MLPMNFRGRVEQIRAQQLQLFRKAWSFQETGVTREKNPISKEADYVSIDANWIDWWVFWRGG